MRMRKLGRGQSVVFFVPPNVRQKIHGTRMKHHERDISLIDIISWSICETLGDCERSMPIWASQGDRYVRHEAIWDQVGKNSGMIKLEDARKFLEDESPSLEKRYSPQPRLAPGILTEEDNSMPLQKQARLEIQARCKQFGITDTGIASLQEEQERELSIELQSERMIMSIERMEPHISTLHPDVKSFVKTGNIDPESTAFLPAFEIFKHTTAAEFMDLKQFSSELLVTEDFAQTVKQPSLSCKSDIYQRPVQWIVTRFRRKTRHHPTMEYMVIFSPWEVNQLLGDIYKQHAVTLHLYTPRTNLSYAPSDDLQLYNIPRFTRDFEIPRTRTIQLNLFAGQLYLRDYEEYQELCQYLGISSQVRSGDDDDDGPDGFIGRNSRMTARCPFTQSPVPFLKVLMMVIRRDSRDIIKTDIGRILAGDILEKKRFEKRQVVAEENARMDAELSDEM
jgi:hypothetical protein